MILGFSTQLNGKPTYFVEKIWKCLLQQNYNLLAYHKFRTEAVLNKAIDQWDIPNMVLPKLHSVREDPKDRWEKGKMIDFFINVRTKNMFRFAPVLPLVSTQKIAMSYAYNDLIEISINGRELFGQEERERFALNDGFDSWEDFFNYFYPLIKKTEDNWYTAKIIHWTDLRY